MVVFGLLFVVSSAVFLLLRIKYNQPSTHRSQQVTTPISQTPAVSGVGRYRESDLTIYGDDKGGINGTGGVVNMSALEDSSIYLYSYKLVGTLDVDVYEANINQLMEFLAVNEKGNQINPRPNTTDLKLVTSFKQTVNNPDYSYNNLKVDLPIKHQGIWFVNFRYGNTNIGAYIVRSNIGVLAKEGDDQLIFWAQDLKTGRSAPGGKITTYRVRDSRIKLSSADFSTEGIAETNLSASADIALYQNGDDISLIPLNLRYLNTEYNYRPFQENTLLTRYFIFTDRPIYKPGDTVYFKTVLRNDDDARLSVPQGTASVKVTVSYNQGDSWKTETVMQKNFSISSEGTLNGELVLPQDAKTGTYELTVKYPSGAQEANGYGYWHGDYSTNYLSFDVQNYTKPEFFLTASANQTDILAGDTVRINVTGTYFSGQPLIGHKIKYAVYSSDFYAYDYYYGYNHYETVLSDNYRYGYWNGKKVNESTVELDNRGVANITIKTAANTEGKPQVYTIEVASDGPDTPAFSRKNVLVRSGEFDILRKDYRQHAKTGENYTLPLVIIPVLSNFSIKGTELTANIQRKSWTYNYNPDTKVYSSSKQEEVLPEQKLTTDSNGGATLSFVPRTNGSYDIKISGRDTRGNIVSKTFYIYSSDDNYYYSDTGGMSELIVTADKKQYDPTDAAELTISSKVSNRDVFLALERGRVNRYQVVRIQGNSAKVTVPLVPTDVPNMALKVSSFTAEDLISSTIDIPVSADGKKLTVSLTPNSKKVGPGETVSVNIQTINFSGDPISADVAFWAVDKAIFELSDSNLGNIFDTFWFNRYDSTQEANSLEGITAYDAGGHGGCFVSGTRVSVDNNKSKNIEDIKPGDLVLSKTSPTDRNTVKKRVVAISRAVESGYLIINSNLKITPDHLLLVNGSWSEAAMIQTGNKLLDLNNNEVTVTSLEWQLEKTEVYNLMVEDTHTFFAEGVLVHNAKGAARSVFKDTAYWNPSIKTDGSGRAKITFKVPDNLTTWTLSAVANTKDSVVGQTTTDLIVTKDVIVRPILPNILRVGDKAKISALVQNFTDTNHTFNVKSIFGAGTVTKPEFTGQTINANDMQQYTWEVEPQTESDKTSFTFSATNTQDKTASDTVISTIPVWDLGFEEKSAQVGTGSKIFDVSLAQDIKPARSSVVLSLSPSIMGTIVQASKYLIDYPYGCMEQTMSRLTPVLLARTNPQFFGDALKGVNIDDMVKTGMEKVKSNQNPDGGWGWGSAGASDPFVSTYVAESLVRAKDAGLAVDSGVMTKMAGFFGNLPQDTTTPKITSVYKNYSLALIMGKSQLIEVLDADKWDPDLLAFAVMSNYLNGYKHPDINGLTKLASMAQIQGEQAHWGSGELIRFGSSDASTALAMRALLTAGGNKDLCPIPR